MNGQPKTDVKALPKEDVKDRSTGAPHVSRDDEASPGGDKNSGTEREPQRKKIAPDLDPNNTD